MLTRPNKHWPKHNIDVYHIFSSQMKDMIEEETENFQNVKLLVKRASVISCKALDSEELTCNECIDEFNWKLCKHLGAETLLEIEMKEEKYGTQLREFRETIIFPLLRSYVENTQYLQTNEMTRIFLTLAPTHTCFELPNAEKFIAEKKDKIALEALDIYENNTHKEIICIPAMPFRSHSLTNVYETKNHFRKCFEEILKIFKNKNLSIYTYFGSSNINVRGYLQALMEFDNLSYQDILNWNFFDFLHSRNVSDNETVKWGIEKRKEKNSGYHLLPSLPHTLDLEGKPSYTKRLNKKTSKITHLESVLSEKELEITRLESVLSEKELEITRLESKAEKNRQTWIKIHDTIGKTLEEE